jgi:transposase
MKKDFEMRKSYPSDISRKQFAEIEALLVSARKITAPRKLDLYDVFCAVLYVLRTACQWRMLPSDFPKWRSVHSYFQIWNERVNNQPSLLEQVLKKIGSTHPYCRWSSRKNVTTRP